jgi:hypothetical protein
MSGMKFRTASSKTMYSKLKGITPLKEDILINRTFKESLQFFVKKN